MSGQSQTRAIDVDCPNTEACGALVGELCTGGGVGADFCQKRIDLASKVTRRINIAKQKASGKRR